MKKILPSLFLIFYSLVFSQKKNDTVRFYFAKNEYEKSAVSLVNLMIESNKKFGNGERNLIYNSDGLEVIVHPEFRFKKEIAQEKGTGNLVKYIDFENNPENQIFEIYRNGKFVYTFHPADFHRFKNAVDPELSGILTLPKSENPYFFDYNYIFKDFFTFYIDGKFCILQNGRISTITYVAIPSQIKIEPFNYTFYPELNRLKMEAKGEKMTAYKEFILKNKIPDAVLEILNK